MPIKTSPSNTGKHPIFRSTITRAADLTNVSGKVVMTSFVMTSLTRIVFNVRSRVAVPKPSARTSALKPVRGPIFKALEPGDERLVLLRLDNIVRYLQSIQVK
jgi:hypothetical protein